MQTNPDQFRNYRNYSDVIGNVTGNTTKTAIYAAGNKGGADLFEALDNHSLSAWQFSEDGNLLLLGGQESSGTIIESMSTIRHQTKLSMKSSSLKRGQTPDFMLFYKTSKATFL